MKVEIFVPAYNGMHILPLFLDHYQERFPECTINIYNDNSTDETGDYCRGRGCNVIDYIAEEPKGNSVTYIRNNCWKESKAEWIIVVDQDELINISLADLDAIENFDVIKFKGYNMIVQEGQNGPREFTHGKLHPWYCKPLMFRKSVGEMNYIGGAHVAYPPEETRFNRYYFTMFHYPKRFYSKEEFIKEYLVSISAEVASDLYDRDIRDIKKLQKLI
jgi:glycosyltransferase involved in cell wall biosynthesis